MTTRILTIVLIIVSLLFSQNATASENKITVFVSIVPQKYIVQQIGKDHVDIHIMVQPGASPATYEPKPRQMATLSDTALYFSVGVPFEKVWLARIAAANRRMKIVATDAGIEKRVMTGSHHHDHDGHDSHDDHQDEVDDHTPTPDPHIWVAPPLVREQARIVMEALKDIDPEHQNEYMANFIRFEKEIQALHAELQDAFADRQGAAFMVFHPSWGYFADTYGLHQIPIEIEGKAPKPSQLKETIELAREKKIKAIFIQPQFSAKSANLIAKAIGATVIVADPLAEDWADNLRRHASQLKNAIR